jgi:hypothetical protein
MRSSLLMPTVALNVVVPYVKLLAFVFYSKFQRFPFHNCFSPLNTFPLLDMGQPQIPFVKILMYLVNNWSH